MKINIIYHNNGFGLTKDANIIKGILKEHTFNMISTYEQSLLEKADLNIFLEVLDRNDKKFHQYKKLAKRNIFFPNVEWFCNGWIEYLKEFDTICCKTKHSEKVLNDLGCDNTFFTSFTSENQWDENITNKYRGFFHSAGKSNNKGTDKLIQAWKTLENSQYKLFLLRKGQSGLSNKNIFLYNDYLKEKDFIKLKNQYLFHVYPTRYEGFGHNIWESKSMGAVVITTDAEPMNGYCKDFPLRSSRGKKHGLVYFNEVNPDSIIEQCKKAYKLGINEIHDIAERNIIEYLANDEFFKQQLKRVVNV